MVKLDLEGFELDALMGMKQMLRERRIRYITSFERWDIQCLGSITGSSALNVAATSSLAESPGRQTMLRHMKLRKQSDSWNAVCGNPSAPANIYFSQAQSRTTHRRRLRRAGR